MLVFIELVEENIVSVFSRKQIFKNEKNYIHNCRLSHMMSSILSKINQFLYNLSQASTYSIGCIMIH